MFIYRTDSPSKYLLLLFQLSIFFPLYTYFHYMEGKLQIWKSIHGYFSPLLLGTFFILSAGVPGFGEKIQDDTSTRNALDSVR